ncbi:MAG: alanine--tRNA ligase [Patescibacteria group bacterium]
MTAQDIRKRYLEFMEARGHKVIDRASLVLHDDPTTLFTGSGMQPLMPYLLGEPHPDGERVVDSQTCIRAQDMDEVGDNSHTTFFEMLGNWSFGDYFKKDQIRWFFEFLVDEVGLDPSKIYATCFIGDEDAGVPRDEESAAIWVELFKERGIEAKVVEIGSSDDGDKVGMQGGRIFYYDDGENWWSRAGGIDKTPAGDPCGPDSEVFYDFGEELHDEARWGKAHPANDSGRFMEIGNQVFMQYKRTEGGFEDLPAQNVDFGAGLERIAAAKLQSPDVFKISLMWPVIVKLVELTGKSYEEHTESMRVIVDHLRASMFLAVDGVIPSNKEHGYVMRRLMRRAIRFAFDLDLDKDVCAQAVPIIAEAYRDDYPELAENEAAITKLMHKEEQVFRQTLRAGVRMFEKDVKDQLTGENVFKLYDTYGFPVELSIEEAKMRGIKVSDSWEPDFQECMEQQRERSRTADKGDFKGGLAARDEIHTKYHTTTHIMYKALRIVLGDHVEQRGSNITHERTRFDFNHPERMTDEQKAEVERIVNEVIDNDLPVSFKEMPTPDALATGARGHFGDKYGDTVIVYIIGPEEEPWTMELCGGPHVERTGKLGDDGKRFKILKEQSSSAGIRRIKAALV